MAKNHLLIIGIVSIVCNTMLLASRFAARRRVTSSAMPKSVQPSQPAVVNPIRTSVGAQNRPSVVSQNVPRATTTSSSFGATGVITNWRGLKMAASQKLKEIKNDPQKIITQVKVGSQVVSGEILLFKKKHPILYWLLPGSFVQKYFVHRAAKRLAK